MSRARSKKAATVIVMHWWRVAIGWHKSGDVTELASNPGQPQTYRSTAMAADRRTDYQSEKERETGWPSEMVC